MKKLFTLSVILLLVSNVFSQTQGVFGRIFDEPEHLRFEKYDAEGNILPFVDGTTEAYRHLSLSYYHFIKDNKLYMLSYGEPAPSGLTGGTYFERKLYLFCWGDGVWSKASDVIRVDKKFKNGGIRGYLPMFDGDFGGRVEVVGDCVLITLACHYLPNTDYPCISEIYTKKFVLIPNGDGTYNVLHDTKNND